MKIIIFGLTITSSWGNGHATLWRGLCRALLAAGHEIVFFERNLPYYAAHRDLHELPGGEIVLFEKFEDVRTQAQMHLCDADVAIVTSYCPDALAATELTEASSVLRVFYDLDSPVTLARLVRGEEVPYLGARGLRDFDLALSYAGRAVLEEMQTRLGARQVAPLYGSVDPSEHQPAPPQPEFRADLSYLGTFAADRQGALEQLLVIPARRRPRARFVIGGAQYPDEFPWAPNINFVRHLPPAQHASFYGSSRLTLNVTRAAMAENGYCPSGRLFEAAACGAAVISDRWPGLEDFFTPGREILVADHPDDVLAALDLPDDTLRAIGLAARERALSEHTSARRAEQLLALLEAAHSPKIAVLCGE